MPKSTLPSPTPSLSQILSWGGSVDTEDIRSIDHAIYQFLSNEDISRPSHVRDPEFVYLLILKACREIENIFNISGAWGSMNFSADTYFLVFSSEINVETFFEKRRLNILLFIHPEDFRHIMENLTFFIENKRIINGVRDYAI